MCDIAVLFFSPLFLGMLLTGMEISLLDAIRHQVEPV